jgi:choline dehydrogenase-like flavoprotein
MADADIIVIGSGHNGLVAAAYLAVAGRNVLVLERNDWVGGDPGSDRLFGGAGHDMVRGGRDADYVNGGDGTDQLARRREGLRAPPLNGS